MTKSIYDNGEFFNAYKAMHDSGPSGGTGFITIPEQYALLPDLGGKKVLDLGCGFGDFLRYASSRGAVKLTGIDSSARMLEAAHSRSAQHNIQFIQQELEMLDVQECYDLCFSSLALHYVQNIHVLFSEVAKILVQNGQFIFSVEHPIASAEAVGWHKEEYSTQWGVEDYLSEGKRITDWFGQKAVKYHRVRKRH